MAQSFSKRLREYYLRVAKVLRGEADAASIFPNSSDVGVSRERIYADFLRQHTPSKCNVFLGGFLFHMDGSESKQLDIIVTTDTAPRFDFHNPDGGGKSFSPVEGTLGVVSIKSNLDKKELHDALNGIASIPPTTALEGRVAFGVKISDYDDWPYKAIYASSGVSSVTLVNHIREFYRDNPTIPLSRRPNLIHVSGEYLVVRIGNRQHIESSERSADEIQLGEFYALITEPDIQGLQWIINGIQQNALASTHIIYNYNGLIDLAHKDT